MAKIVYIDQNHLSNFGRAIDEPSRYSVQFQEYNKLMEYVKSGEIIVPISYCHIIESFRHKGKLEKLHGYCQVVQELSNNYALKLWDKLFDYEIRMFYESVMLNKPMEKDLSYSIGSYADLLIDKPGLSTKDFLEESIEGVVLRLKEWGCSENMVRKQFKEWKKSGMLQQIVKEIEKDKNTPLQKQDLTNESFFLNGNLVKLIFGSSEERIDAEKKLFDGAMNFRRLIYKWSDIPAAERLRLMPEQMFTSLEKIIQDNKQFKIDTGQDAINKNEIWESAVEILLNKLISDSIKKQDLNEGEIEKITSGLRRTKYKAIPSLHCLLSVFMSYLKSHTGPTPRKSKVSDSIDLRHCFYIPYADFFLTENNMAAMMKEVGKEWDTVLISKSTQLFDHLDGN